MLNDAQPKLNHHICIFENTFLDFSKMREFTTLRLALDIATTNTLVFAQDLNASGIKKFIVGTLNECILKYNSLTKRHWYECLLENRPSRLFLDVDADVNIENLIQYVQKCTTLMFQKQVHFQILDASSSQKTSYHLIGDLVFKNVYHVGAFIRRVLMSMIVENIPEKDAIDHAVYTRNRMFRIKGSTKFGSVRVLKHPNPWHTLLVQTTGEYVECLELDNSIPRSTSMHPHNLFIREENDTWSSVRSSKRTLSSELSDLYPLSPIFSWLDKHLDANIIRHNIKMTSNGICIVPTQSKNCKIAERIHKGNHIWFSIDTRTFKVIQRCHDHVCSNGHVQIEVPPIVWSRWLAMWSVQVVIEKNEKTLFNTSY